MIRAAPQCSPQLRVLIDRCGGRVIDRDDEGAIDCRSEKYFTMKKRHIALLATTAISTASLIALHAAAHATSETAGTFIVAQQPPPPDADAEKRKGPPPKQLPQGAPPQAAPPQRPAPAPQQQQQPRVVPPTAPATPHVAPPQPPAARPAPPPPTMEKRTPPPPPPPPPGVEKRVTPPAGERAAPPPPPPGAEKRFTPPAGERNAPPPAGVEKRLPPPTGEKSAAPPPPPPSGERKGPPPSTTVTPPTGQQPRLAPNAVTPQPQGQPPAANAPAGNPPPTAPAPDSFRRQGPAGAPQGGPQPPPAPSGANPPAPGPATTAPSQPSGAAPQGAQIAPNAAPNVAPNFARRPPPQVNAPLPPPPPPQATTPLPQNAQQQGPRDLNAFRGQRREVQEGGRTVITEPGLQIIRDPSGQAFVRHNELDRFRYGARDVRIERQGNDSRAIVFRPDGTQIIDVTGPDGRLLRRIRRDRGGREIIIIDNGFGPPPGAGFGGYYVDLPPPVIRIPQDRYIVDAQYATPDVIYQTLIAPPVERLQRRYTLDEIRYSPGVRERMPSIDLDTINFETGSWDIAPDQAQKLSVIAQGLNEAISRDPRSVFLIEGHTDAVGSDVDNLSLSDRRAQAVAELLTSQFQVPPENLTAQGYGEQYLKIPTQGPEVRNRRVTVRNITPLLQGQSNVVPPPPPGTAPPR